MFKFNDEKGQLKCSFCGKTQDQVRKLVAGPGVYICDECIGLCGHIIDEEMEAIWAGDKTAQEAMDSAKERGDALLRRFEQANR